MLSYYRHYILNRAIKSYIFRLGPALRQRYGWSDEYTVMQIQKTAQHLKLNMRHIDFAIALYRRHASENTIELRNMNQRRLNTLRSSLADALFEGNNTFDASDTLNLSKSAGWKGGSPPNWMANRIGKTSV